MSLTPTERRERAVTEADFSRQVTDLAELLGWSWAHFRPARTARGWRTPVEGPLGAGWPDLTLVRGRRLVFAELKRELEHPSLAQGEVLLTMKAAADTYVWRPSDLRDPIETSRIYAVLR